MTPVAIESVVATYERLGCPAAVLGLATNAAADGGFLRGALLIATPERQKELADAVHAHADQVAAEREEAERARVARVLRGEEEPSEAELAAANLERIEAEVRFQDHERKRPQRVEELLRGIAASLDALVKARR